MTQTRQNGEDNQTRNDGQKWEEEFGKGGNQWCAFCCRLVLGSERALNHQKVGTPVAKAQHEAQAQNDPDKINAKWVTVGSSTSP